MARKRTLNRRDLREQSEAAEAREKDDDEVEDEAAADDDGDDEDGEAKPKKKAAAKKKPAAPKAPKAPSKRTRVPKEVRMKAIWVVFDNASKRVDTFPYSERAKAEDLLAKKQEEKKGTFYISLVKEPME